MLQRLQKSNLVKQPLYITGLIIIKPSLLIGRGHITGSITQSPVGHRSECLTTAQSSNGALDPGMQGHGPTKPWTTILLLFSWDFVQKQKEILSLFRFPVEVFEDRWLRRMRPTTTPASSQLLGFLILAKAVKWHSISEFGEKCELFDSSERLTENKALQKTSET